MDRRTLIVGGMAAALGGGAAASIASMGSSKDYDEAMARLRSPLNPAADVRDVIRLATLAANGHNSQPWRFRVTGSAIRIVPDLSRRTPAVDPDDHHLFVSLGCAAENLAIAAAAAGLAGEAQIEREDGTSILFGYARGAARPSPLCDAIVRRQSARIAYDGRAAAAGDIAQLAAAGEAPGVQLALLTERARIGLVRDLIIAGNSIQMADATFVRELKAWIRFNPRAALASGDGLYSACTGNPILPTWLGAPMFDLAFTASAENDKYARQLDSSSGIAVFAGDRPDPGNWVEVGRACQRFALQATALGMKAAFVNQPVEVASLREDLAGLAGMEGKRPDIVMRFGYGPDLPMSPRRATEDVIDIV